jgi:CDP-diacylglycerol--serine O-phosphatidyltransferase
MKMFTIPNLITGFNMLCGVIAILFAVAGRIDIAPYFIFIGAVLDFLDGFLARILKQQSELGKQLDSLADIITFGLAPGIIMMYVLLAPPLSFQGTIHVELSFLAWIEDFITGKNFNFIPLFGLLIPFFSLFRLANFNIDTRQSESFIGLPTPANTIFFMAFPLLLTQYGNTTGWEHDLIMNAIKPIVLVPVITVMSLLLIANIPLFSLKFKQFSWSGNEWRFGFLISCGLLIAFLWTWSIPIIVLLYLILSIIKNSISKKLNA